MTGTPSAAPDTAAPGQVWWCDGIALSFEPHFKRRPVLVLAVPSGDEDDALLAVAPLSSRRHFGQEQAVTHAGGVSYLTGRLCHVPVTALRQSLGAWEGFAAWQEAQRPGPSLGARLCQYIGGLLGRGA